ncbi:MAG: glucosaminidase domain-containing protein [Mediterranea sp.]|jgi:flagellar protein FlgJ|nr:glucosaminidase domain-containing protein [Mediterranea sp.]
MKPRDFVRWVYPAAQRASDINPVFVVAQAALESGWGEKRVGEYNLFGVTRGSSWRGPVLLCDTTEYFSSPDVAFSAPEAVLSVTKLGERSYRYKVRRYFRDYRSLEEALADHNRVLAGRNFADAWPYRKSPEEFVRRLVDNVGPKYATAPDYASQMNKLFSMVRKIIDQL